MKHLLIATISAVILTATAQAAPYVVYLDSSEELQIVDVATGNRTDTRIKVNGPLQVSAEYVVFLDSSSELQIVELSTGSRRDTRLKVGGDFKITP